MKAHQKSCKVPKVPAPGSAVTNSHRSIISIGHNVPHVAPTDFNSLTFSSDNIANNNDNEMIDTGHNNGHQAHNNGHKPTIMIQFTNL